MKPAIAIRQGRVRSSLAAGVLVVLVVTAYLPAFDAGFIWDDDDYVTRNVTLRSVDGLRRIWLEPGAVPQYYPLVHTSFWLEYHLWGLRPQGYHAVNITLHAVNAVLLWLVLQSLAVPGAWLAAAIFGVHPVHVESVAWITERKNVLSGFFYLSALLAYLRFCGVDRHTARPPDAPGPKRMSQNGQDNRQQTDRQQTKPLPILSSGLLSVRLLSVIRWVMRQPVQPPAPRRREQASSSEAHRAYGLALALFACALLSKTVTGFLPAAILLLLWWKQGRIGRDDIVRLFPFFVLAAGLGGVTIWMEKHRVGATGTDWTFSAIDRCLIAGRALWFYAGKLAWPVQLTLIYPRWAVDSRVWWQYGFPLAAVALVCGLYARRVRLGRGPLVAVLYFAGALVPALGFINVFPMRYTFVADHYQYLASIGLIIVGVSACSAVWQRWMSAEWTPVAAGGVLLLLGLLTWRQTGVYRDVETLWRDTLAKNPSCWMAHDNLGLHLQERGQLDEAVRHYNAALDLKPDEAYAHGNLANTLAAQGRTREAVAHYEAALRLAPDYAEAHSNLGNVLAAAGQLDAAIAHYEAAIRLRPAYADAQSNLANVLVMQGQIAAAITHYLEALRIDPDYAAAHLNLGIVLASAGRTTEAIPHLEAAVRLAPEDAAARAQLERIRGARPPGA